eukprot:TRINITY_DN10862_c0_g1_i2.p1 TRINITY_DN10862_c0_g1~~TRINITY_DN10862_c0_g1_i2.p1  ORF type:complete len:246 (+),score=46.30 TRINITY_DN10862_c0_g1_i2:183-920(+)
MTKELARLPSMGDHKKDSAFHMFPPMYSWGSKIVTSSGRREVRRDPSRRLNRIAQHLLPGPEHRQDSASALLPVPLPELVGDFRLGRFDRKPYKQNAWKLIQINQSQVWCYGGAGDATDNLIISPTAILGNMIEFRTTSESRIIIGDGAVIGDRCILQAGIQVVISAGARLGVGCLVMDRNHHGIGTEPEVMEPIHVGHHASIGDYSVLLAGAKVHELEQVSAVWLLLLAAAAPRPLCGEPAWTC